MDDPGSNLYLEYTAQEEAEIWANLKTTPPLGGSLPTLIYTEQEEAEIWSEFTASGSCGPFHQRR